MSIKITNKFATTDINLAASLVAAGHNLVELNRTEGRRVRFVFREDDDLQQTVATYWDGSLNVSAQRVLNTLRELKNRIYAGG